MNRREFLVMAMRSGAAITMPSPFKGISLFHHGPPNPSEVFEVAVKLMDRHGGVVATNRIPAFPAGRNLYSTAPCTFTSVLHELPVTHWGIEVDGLLATSGIGYDVHTNGKDITIDWGEEPMLVVGE